MSEKGKNVLATGSNLSSDFTRYDFGHLIQRCYVCGQEEVRLRDVSGGLTFFLPVTDKHELTLTCGRCGASLSLSFLKSDRVMTEEEKKEQESALRNGSLTLLKMAQRDQEFSSVADDEMLKFSKQLDFPALMLFWESMRQAIEQSGTRVLSERPISILIPPVYLAGMLYYLQGKVPEDSRPKVRDLVDFFLEHSQPNEELRKALKKAKDRI